VNHAGVIYIHFFPALLLAWFFSYWDFFCLIFFRYFIKCHEKVCIFDILFQLFERFALSHNFRVL
jgi:hypothetical protein